MLFEEDWVKSGMPPLEEVDPSKPWVKDTRGRHHNLLAILDWPEEEGSEEKWLKRKMRIGVNPLPRNLAIRFLRQIWGRKVKEIFNFHQF